MMKIQRTSLLAGATGADGCTVVIDVFRAYTCASIMLSFSPAELRLEEDPAQCLRLKGNQDYLAVGEIDGVPVEGFDLGNSPSAIAARGREFFEGRKVVLRTSAGVRGVFAAREKADSIWAGSYTTAGALARVLRREAPEKVHLVAMGWSGQGKTPEDEQCALCLHSLLDRSVAYNHAAALGEIMGHEAARKFLRGDKEHFPAEDVSWCLQRDLFDFAMKVDDSAGALRILRINSDS